MIKIFFVIRSFQLAFQCKSTTFKKYLIYLQRTSIYFNIQRLKDASFTGDYFSLKEYNFRVSRVKEFSDLLFEFSEERMMTIKKLRFYDENNDRKRWFVVYQAHHDSRLVFKLSFLTRTLVMKLSTYIKDFTDPIRFLFLLEDRDMLDERHWTTLSYLVA